MLDLSCSVKAAINTPTKHFPLRVAYITGSFPYVTETFVVNQIAGIVARGHEADVYTANADKPDNVPGNVRRLRLMDRTHYLHGSRYHIIRLLFAFYSVIRNGWRAPRMVWRSLNVFRYGRAAASLGLLCAALTLRRHALKPYDIVHCQFGTYGELALRLKEIGALSGRLVVSFRGYDATKFLRAHPHAYDELFRRADLFLPVSEALAQRLVEAGCDRKKIVVHHSGIDMTKFRFVERNISKPQSVALLSIARLTEKKGLEYAIRAVAELVVSGRQLTYTIVGEGPLRPALEQLCQELGIVAQVKFIGWRDHNEVIGLLERTHILIAPSVIAADGDEEGIPNVVKEAMAIGVPVVGTRHGGIPEVIEDGVSGALVSERDAGAIAGKLSYLLDHPQEWAALGQAARRRVTDQFDIEKLNDDLVDLYQELQNNAENVYEDNAYREQL